MRKELNIQGDLIISPKYKKEITEFIIKDKIVTSKELLHIFKNEKRYLERYLPLASVARVVPMMDHHYNGHIRNYYSQLDPRLNLLNVRYFINNKKKDFDIKTYEKIEYIALESEMDEILGETISRMTMRPMIGGSLIFDKEELVHILNELNEIIKQCMVKNESKYIPIVGLEYNKTIFSKLLTGIETLLMYLSDIKDSNVYIMDNTSSSGGSLRLRDSYDSGIRFPIKGEVI